MTKVKGKTFSVFNKLKEFLRSGVQSTYTNFGSQIDPDKIKVEYDEEKVDDSKKKLVKNVKTQFKSDGDLPKEMISI